jgi:HEAT repeat protein
MHNNEFINFGNGHTSLNFPDSEEKSSPHISSADYAFSRGERNATKYSDDELVEMLQSGDYEDIHRALGAIGKKKLKKALPYLKNIALYDEDQAIQREAIRTIRKIGGRKAFEILRFLKTTEHRDLVQQMLDLKHIEDIDAY